MSVALDIFRALSDPTRLRIYALLRAMELSVGELAQVLGQSQPRISRHVKILADAGLTARRREGSWTFLSLGAEATTSAVSDMIDRIGGQSHQDHWFRADLARLEAVRADRAAAAARYFEAHAGQWDAIRALHIADSTAEQAMRNMLDSAPIGRLVDIGTGTGRMLHLFGPQSERAIGIDRSPEMLRLARVGLADSGIEQAELRQGDMYALPLDSGDADTAILHHVLHFAHQPSQAIAEAARLLRQGGRLLIVDFARHDHEELRNEFAHVRLGFEDEQIAQWCDLAGANLIETRALAGAKLTVKLWLGKKTAATELRKAVA